MRKSLVLLGLLCAACGCAGTASYQTVLQIKHAEKPGEYLVGATIREHRSAWYRQAGRMYNAPVIHCVAGKLAMASMTEEAGNADGVFLEAFVTQADGSGESQLVVMLKRDGVVICRSEVLLPALPASPAPGKPPDGQ
jgi:hypothetical protein